MSLDLLDKTRKITGFIRENQNSKVIFTDLCDLVGEMIRSNIYVVSAKGKLLALSEKECPTFLDEIHKDKSEILDRKLTNRFMDVLSTRENMKPEMLGLTQHSPERLYTMVSPVFYSEDRLGTLFMYRERNEFEIDDIILTEYLAMVISLEMLRSLNLETSSVIQNKKSTESVKSILTPLEQQAVSELLKSIPNEEGDVVISKVADKIGITRTVIINAIKHMESAGLIYTRSRGVKGTYIKILNKNIYHEF